MLHIYHNVICANLWKWNSNSVCVMHINDRSSVFFSLINLLSMYLVKDIYSIFILHNFSTGYSIFVVIGDLPLCEADQLLKLVPAVQIIKPRLLGDQESHDATSSRSRSADSDLERALEESRQLADDDDLILRQALALSMQGKPLVNTSFQMSHVGGKPLPR